MSPKRTDEVCVTVPPRATCAAPFCSRASVSHDQATSRQHLVAELLGIQPRLHEADEPERALPGVLARGVVQQDQPPRRVGLVEVLAGPAGGVGLDAHGPREGREPGRCLERGDHQLRPRPHGRQRGTACRNAAGTAVGSDTSGDSRSTPRVVRYRRAGDRSGDPGRGPRRTERASCAGGLARGSPAPTCEDGASWSPRPRPPSRPCPRARRDLRDAPFLAAARGGRARARAGVVHAPGGPLAARVPRAARRHRHARRLLDARAGLRDHAAAGAPARGGRGDPLQRHRRAAARRGHRRGHRARHRARSSPSRCAPPRTSTGCRPLHAEQVAPVAEAVGAAGRASSAPPR